MSGSYFVGNISSIGSSMRKTLITNSAITNTSLDMNMKKITSVDDPTDGKDAANKVYVDRAIDYIEQNVSELFTGYMITLQGTCFSEIPEDIKPGALNLTISSQRDGGPSANFSLTKSGVYSDGFPNRLTGTPGLNTGEMLEVIWPAAQRIKIRKTSAGYDGEYLVNLGLKTLSTKPPVIESDLSTKAYVDTSIMTAVDVKFGGIMVQLSGMTFANVVNLKPGTYTINVSPINCTSAPTASFSVSKNKMSSDAHVVVISQMHGDITGETLQLRWPANSMIQLSKSGNFYDATYLCDMGLKNFSSSNTSIPSDLASISYVNEQVSTYIANYFEGISISLQGITFVNTTSLRNGSYFITVWSLVNHAPTCTFAISKGSSELDADISRMTNISGKDTGEVIELIWPPNQLLQIRKTGVQYDGIYYLDFNLKNTGLTPPQLPTDVATVEFVENEIDTKVSATYAGIQVGLVDNTFSSVMQLKLGSYMIIVAPIPGLIGPTSTFMISKSLDGVDAHIVKLSSSSPEINNMPNSCQLELIWEANDLLKLRLVTVGLPIGSYTGIYIVNSNLLNFSSGVPNPVLGDTPTMSYVQEYVDNKFNVKFSGINVTLSGITFYDVTDLRAGSFCISVFSIFDGGPTCLFNVSKSSIYVDAHVVRVSSSNGYNYNTQQQLHDSIIELTWLANQPIRIRKTNAFHDGDYIVDFNLKNFNILPPPIIETDQVTVEYLNQRLQHELDVKFGGIQVNLQGTSFQKVVALNPGGYIISISCSVYGGSSCVFGITKNLSSGTASIIRLTSSPSINDGQLELIWGPNEALMLRKTEVTLDGVYTCSFSIQNFSTVDTISSQIGLSSIATREYVYDTFNSLLNAEFSGIIVQLTDTSFSDVIALKAGSYMCAVSSQLDGGPSALFSVSRASNVTGTAHIVRLTSCKSKSGTSLELIWEQDSTLKLRKDTIYDDSNFICDFNLRNFTSGPTILPTDVATQGFVNNAIQSYLDVNFGGINVDLTGMEYSVIAPLTPGSYSINISPNIDGGGSASFQISKSSYYSNADIVRVSSSPGIDFGEELELMWVGNSKLMLHKTKIDNDGAYLVNLNLRSFATNLSTSVQSDTVSVTLNGSTTTEISNSLEIGSYIIKITSSITNAPMGTFTLSKNNINSDAVISTLTEMYPSPSEVLVLQWFGNDALKIHKTSLQYNGSYTVKII